MKTIDAKLFEVANRLGDFRLAHSYRDEHSGNINWSKHRTVLECLETDWGVNWMNNKANHRQIWKDEVILDKDEGATEEWFNMACDGLDMYPFDYKGYFSGSKGYHIHIKCPKIAFMPRWEREEFREKFIIAFKCDKMKKSDNCLIARENMPHWKTGVLKICLRRKINEEE